MAIYQRRGNKFVEIETIRVKHKSSRLITIDNFPNNLATLDNNISLTATSILNPPQKIVGYHLSIPQLNISIESEDGNFSFYIDERYDKKIVSLIIYALDELGNVSDDEAKLVKVVGSYVKRPVIQTPKNNSGINDTTVTVISDDFSITGTPRPDTHVSTEYVLALDEERLNVVEQKISDIELLSTTFSSLEIQETYYIFVRYKGENFGYSPWSEPVKIKVEIILSEGGRKIYRHESNMGSVIEFNDRQPRKVLVLDAAYRTTRKFGAYGIDAPALNITPKNIYNRNWIEGYVSTTPGAVLTDAQLNHIWVTLYSRTSKYLCDTWMTYTNTSNSGITGVPAVEYCRSIIVDGAPCDLPNISTLIRIFCEAINLDALDPTVDDNRNYALTTWSFDGTSDAWTSEEYTDIYINIVNYNGGIVGCTRTAFSGVVPVLELDS